MKVLFPSIAMVKRELLSSLREKKTFGLLALTVGALFAMTLIVVSVGMKGPATQTFLMFFMALLSASACMFITPIAATSICVEKQQGTFEILRATLVRPRGIVFAKLFNVFAIFVFIVLGAMPVVGVLFFFVGIMWEQFLGALVLLLMLALACGAVGILCSAYFHRSLVSIIVSYLLLLAFLGLPEGLLGLLAAILQEAHLVPSEFQRFLEDVAEHTFAVWCPPAVMATTILSAVDRERFLMAFVSQGTFILACSFLTIRILWRPAKPMRVDTRKMIDDARVLERRRKKFPFYLIDLLRRREPIPDRRNPILVKELFTGFLSKGASRVRLVYVCTILGFFVACLPIMQYGGREFHDALIGALVFQTIVILFITPAMLANAMAKEHELGNLDMLRTSLLTPRQIILGKLAAGLAGIAPLVLGSLLGMSPVLLMALGDAYDRAVCVSTLGAACVGVLLLACVSLRAAVRRRTTATALVSSYMAGLLLCFFLPIVLLVLVETLETRWTGLRRLYRADMTWLFYAIPSPMAAQLANLDVHSVYRIGEAGNEAGSLLNSRWLCNILECALLSFVLICDSVRVYARRIARDR